MFGPLAKRVGHQLVLALWALGWRVADLTTRWAQQVGGPLDPFDRLIRWYARLTIRVALLSFVLVPCAMHWNWSRLQINGRLSDKLLKDVVAQRVVPGIAHKTTPQLREDMLSGSWRCFVPAGASAAGLAPHLNAPSFSSASTWIDTALPWLGMIGGWSMSPMGTS